MKVLSTVIVILAVLGLLAFKNPSMDDYHNYLRQSIVKEFQKEKSEVLEQVLGPLVGGLASTLVSSRTVRTDLIFMSLYEARLGDEKLKVLGILNNFIVLKKPEFKDGKRP